MEDEPKVRAMISRILRGKGFTVYEAANGEEAIRVAEQRSYANIHLLITDVVMPRMGGKEIADRLTAVCPSIKVLYISGYTDDSIVHHGVLQPGLEFLEKPFSPVALVRKVRGVLAR